MEVLGQSEFCKKKVLQEGPRWSQPQVEEEGTLKEDRKSQKEF